MIDGVDLMPHITGKGPRRRTISSTGAPAAGKSFAVRQGNWKLVKIGNRTELYDLEADISESKDAASAKPEVLQRLETARVSWNKELIAPLFQSPAPAAAKKKAK